ncbi:MAG: C69 family dipeptidase [Bacteroidales bacterium]|nr:C69 family dipeptidase [Bacteroidales bacterium]
MKKNFLIASSLVMILMFGIHAGSSACTNFLITKGASADGSTMITYSADSHVLYGELYFWPAADYPEGAMLDIVEWDTGKPLGKIPQISHTFSVVGNMNENQVAIGETTYGGREELATQSGAIMDYGSLIYVTLQRAASARDAIRIIAELMDTYGYASSGESFSISDKNEVWIMEIIGKGEGQKGAVWVALQVPDGYICGHANQARITTFPYQKVNNWNDANATCYNAPDVISFAREKEWWKGSDKDFSFSDTYAPVGFGGARFCEARVYAMFNRVNSGMAPYENYARGVIEHDANGYAANRMPLWVKPDHKVTVKEVMDLMRDHYENTSMDMNNDFGAGPFQSPYRWRPMTWEVDSVGYCNERATSTQQTGFVFVTQSRNWLPDPIGGIFWFSVDDTYTNCYAPMYCGILEVPEPFAVGNGDMLTYSPTSAFWIFTFVSNWAYTKYNYMIKDIQKVQTRMENFFINATPGVDKEALALYGESPAAAREFLTDYSDAMGNFTVDTWRDLGQYLLVKYHDGNVKKEKDGTFERNEWGVPAFPDQPGYPEWWMKKIADDCGDNVKVIGSAH